MPIAAILEAVVPAAALLGLAAVVLEILVKDPRALAGIVTDVRAMAEPARPARSYPVANTNIAAEQRHAA